MFTTISGQNGKACMYSNPRCGDCRSSDEECPDVASSLCGPFGSTGNAETIDLGSERACQAYAFGDKGDYVSNSDLQDSVVGLPAWMYGLMRVVFDDESPLRMNSTAKNGSMINKVPNSSKVGGLPCWTPGQGCAKEVVEKGGLTGEVALDCINQAAYHCLEDKLEDAACDYITAGVASAMCKSKYFGAAKKFVNTVINHYAEEPIVHAATKFEEGCAEAAKKVGHFFSHFF